MLNGDVDAILVDHAFAVEKVSEFAGRLAIVGPQVELDQGIGIGVRENSDLKGKFDVGHTAKCRRTAPSTPLS